MQMIRNALVALVILVIPQLALAAKGVVVYARPSCDYYIVETSTGFDLLEWYGGYTPDEGDLIVGEFESYGFYDIYDVTADQESTAWVEDFWLSGSDAAAGYLEQCQ